VDARGVADLMRTPTDLYATRDRTRVVEVGPDAAFLLLRAGAEILRSRFDGFSAATGADLYRQATAIADRVTKAKAEPPPPNKAETEPPEDKAETPTRGRPRKAED